MNKRMARTFVSLAVIGAMVATGAAQCGSDGGGSGGQQTTAAKQSCPPGDNNYSWCSNNPNNPPVTVSANPAATNPGVGRVSGACHFSIQSPSGDSGLGGSGLRPKKMNDVLVNTVGFVYGYCTDIIHDFTLDLSIYGGPPGTHEGGTDFTKNKRAHEMVTRAAKLPIPGPIPVPYAISMPCIPGLEMQLVYTYTARDDAGNFIGGGPNGGSIVQFTRELCGAVMKGN